jgi:hypothetical protein
MANTLETPDQQDKPTDDAEKLLRADRDDALGYSREQFEFEPKKRTAKSKRRKSTRKPSAKKRRKKR